MKRVNIAWARKLLGTKNFVVLTDDESVVNIQNVDPSLLKNVTMLKTQAASLELFRDRIDVLLSDHQRRINVLTRKARRGKQRGSARAARPVSTTKSKRVPKSV